MAAFQTLQGLYLLGFLVPLALLYFIRAKPKDLTIPSVMFFADIKRQKKFNALFQKLLVRSVSYWILHLDNRTAFYFLML